MDMTLVQEMYLLRFHEVDLIGAEIGNLCKNCIEAFYHCKFKEIPTLRPLVTEAWSP